MTDRRDDDDGALDAIAILVVALLGESANQGKAVGY
jgi:hypothetical protein